MSEIVPANPFTGNRLDQGLPKTGEYYWIKPDPENEEEKDQEPSLMCVERVYSNHVAFSIDNAKWSTTERVSIFDLLARVTFEPDWKRIIEDRMLKIKGEMEKATKLLYDEAVKKGALPSEAAEVPQNPSCMLPAIRVNDPKKQKRALVSLQKNIPVVTKKIGELAKDYAAEATALVLPELFRLKEMERKLHVVEDQIFTLEVYSGLQEEVHQIRDGEPAGVAEPVAIRQSMLYMDEETLFDYDKGGMDFRKLADFDEWVTRPENLARILPEPRGIVAFRVRRNMKERACYSFLDAWVNARENQWNMETYLLIRNGDRCYRIASEVDFSPRLIPLRSEFDDAFKKTHRGSYNFDTRQSDPDTIEIITPQDFSYDKKAEELHDSLKHYNRIVVLIQGLLDRSDVFHPHPPINLSIEDSLLQWTRFIRDEEDTIGTVEESWRDYWNQKNCLIAADSIVYIGMHKDRKKRSWHFNKMPEITSVIRVRLGKESDVIPEENRGRHYHVEGRSLEECLGVLGVDIAWEAGEKKYPRYSWSENQEIREKLCHAWIPMHEVFNISEYRLGDYKKFAGSRKQKAEYIKWAPAFLSAEDWHAKQAEKDRKILAKAKHLSK